MVRYQALLKSLVSRLNVGDNKLASPSLYASLMHSCYTIANDNKEHLTRDHTSLAEGSVQYEKCTAIFDALTVVAQIRYSEMSPSTFTSPSLLESAHGVRRFSYNSVIQSRAGMFRQLLFFLSAHRYVLPPLLCSNVAQYIYRTNYFVVPDHNTLSSLTCILAVLVDDHHHEDTKNELVLHIHNERGYQHVASTLQTDAASTQPQVLLSVIEAAIRELPKNRRFYDDNLQRMVSMSESEIQWGESSAPAAPKNAKSTTAPGASSRFRERSRKNVDRTSASTRGSVRREETVDRTNNAVTAVVFSRYKVPAEVEMARRENRARTLAPNAVNMADFIHFCFAFFFAISKYLVFAKRASKPDVEGLVTLQDFFLFLHSQMDAPSASTAGDSQAQTKWASESKALSDIFVGCLDNLVLFKNFTLILEKRTLLEPIEFTLLTLLSLSPILELSQRGTRYLSLYSAHLQRVRQCPSSSSAVDPIVTRDVLQNIYSVTLSKYAWSFAVLTPRYMTFIETLMPVLPFFSDEKQSVLAITSIHAHYEALRGDLSAIVFAEAYRALTGAMRFFALVGFQTLLQKHISSLVYYTRIYLKQGKSAVRTLQITDSVKAITQIAGIATLLTQNWRSESNEPDIIVLDIQSSVCMADIFCGLSKLLLPSEEHKKRQNAHCVVQHLQHFSHLVQLRVESYSHPERVANFSGKDRFRPFYYWLSTVLQLVTEMQGTRHDASAAGPADWLDAVLGQAADVYAEVIRCTPHLPPWVETIKRVRDGAVEKTSNTHELDRCLQTAVVTWDVLSSKDDSAFAPQRTDADGKESTLIETDGACERRPESPVKRAQSSLREPLMDFLAIIYGSMCNEAGRKERGSLLLVLPSFFSLLPRVAQTSEEISTSLPNFNDALCAEMETFKSEVQTLISQLTDRGTTEAHGQDATVLLQRVVLLQRTCISLLQCGVLLSLPAQHGFLPLVTETLQCVVGLAEEKRPSSKRVSQSDAKSITSDNVLTSTLRQDPELLLQVVENVNTLYVFAAPHFTSSRSYRQLVVQLSKLCFVSSLSLAKSPTAPHVSAVVHPTASTASTAHHSSSAEREYATRQQKYRFMDAQDAATQHIFYMCLASQQLFRFVGLLLQYPLRSLPSERYIKIMLPIIVFRATYAKVLFRMSKTRRMNNKDHSGDTEMENDAPYRLPNVRIFGLATYRRNARRLTFHIKDEQAEIRARKMKRYYLYFAAFAKIVLKNMRYYDRHMKHLAPKAAPYIISAEESVPLILLCDSMQFFFAKEELFDATMKELFQVAACQVLDALEAPAANGNGVSLEEYLFQRGFVPLSVLSIVFRLYAYVDNVKDITRLVCLLNQQIEKTIPLVSPASSQLSAPERVNDSENEGGSESYTAADKDRQNLSRILQGIREGNKVL